MIWLCQWNQYKVLYMLEYSHYLFNPIQKINPCLLSKTCRFFFWFVCLFVLEVWTTTFSTVISKSEHKAGSFPSLHHSNVSPSWFDICRFNVRSGQKVKHWERQWLFPQCSTQKLTLEDGILWKFRFLLPQKAYPQESFSYSRAT